MRGIFVLLAGGDIAIAQTTPSWPVKPVTIIVPSQPGAANDIEARLYAQRMSENLGRAVVIDYKPGAGSTSGTHYVVKSAPDGHNLIVLAPTFTFSNLAYLASTPEAFRQRIASDSARWRKLAQDTGAKLAQ